MTMSDALTNENGAHIRALASLVPRLNTYLGDDPAFQALIGRFKEVRKNYNIAFVKATQNCESRQICSDEATKVFRLIISSCNVEDELLVVTGTLLNLIDQQLETIGGAGSKGSKSDKGRILMEHRRTLKQLHTLVQQAAFGESRGARNIASIDGGNDKCDDCGVLLSVNAERSEKSCPQCARVYPIFGVVFDEAQLHQQEGQRGKSGCFSPSAHYEEWMRNILALESEELLCKKGVDESPAELIRRLNAEAHKRNKIVSMLGVEDVRALLKSIGRTDLNAHTSLILKKLTGRGPPDISKERRLEAGTRFSRVLAVRESLTENTGNRRYYPYYTIKIFDLILPRGDPDRDVFRFIHLQSTDTLHKNDTEWRRICAELEWEYRPTDPATLL